MICPECGRDYYGGPPLYHLIVDHGWQREKAERYYDEQIEKLLAETREG
jgi:hypothetical protein